MTVIKFPTTKDQQEQLDQMQLDIGSHPVECVIQHPMMKRIAKGFAPCPQSLTHYEEVPSPHPNWKKGARH